MVGTAQAAEASGAWIMFSWNKPKVHVYSSEYQVIVNEAARFECCETGGDLFGTFTHGGVPVIWLASGPGPKARGSRVEFEQDPEFRTCWQRRLTREFAVQYIGSWHSHHTLGLRQPSAGDIEAAHAYAVRHGRPKTLEVIVTLEGPCRTPILHPFFYMDAMHRQFEEWVFNIMPGDSPLRAKLGEDERLFSGVRTRSEAVVSPDDGGAGEDKGQPFPPDLLMEISLLAEVGLDRDMVEVDSRDNRFLVLVNIDGTARSPLLGVAIEYPPGGAPPTIRQVNYIDTDRDVNQNMDDQFKSLGIVITQENWGGGALLTLLRATPQWRHQFWQQPGHGA
jgi:hypothetical protein